MHTGYHQKYVSGTNKYRDINFICNASPIYKVFMPPHHFQNPYATPFYATPQKYEILMPPLLMPPPKILMPPRLCHPQGWHKKRGGGIKKKTNEWESKFFIFWAVGGIQFEFW